MKSVLFALVLTAGSFDMLDAAPVRFDMIGDVPPPVVQSAVAVSLPPSQPVRAVVPGPTAVRRGYPTHPVRWNVNGYWNYSREYIIHHLLTAPEHRGDFSRAYLNSLTKAELQALHDDDHERRVRWSYVRSAAVPAVQAAVPMMAVRVSVMPPVFDFIDSLPPGSKISIEKERDGDVEYRVKTPSQPVYRYEYKAPKRRRGLFGWLGGCPGGVCPSG